MVSRYHYRLHKYKDLLSDKDKKIIIIIFSSKNIVLSLLHISLHEIRKTNQTLRQDKYSQRLFKIN